MITEADIGRQFTGTDIHVHKFRAVLKVRIVATDEPPHATLAFRKKQEY
jgi:hypothetical protein